MLSLFSIQNSTDSNVTGRLKRKLFPKDLECKNFEKFLPPEEANLILYETLKNFFIEKYSILINSTCGCGKSQFIINEIRFKKQAIKILYIVKNHSLAAELKTKFDAIKVPGMINHSSMIHIKGKEKLCELPDIVELYKENQIPIPTAKCLNNCPLFTQCNYISQFDSPADIRIMTMQEFSENSSSFFNGSNMSKDNWLPDFIIVDENIIDTKISVMNNPLGKKISTLVSRGQSLKDAIIELKNEICKKEKSVKYVDDESYIKNYNNYSEILKPLQMFCETNNTEFLHGIKTTSDGLKMIKMIKIQEKYQGIPTLFLDATANEHIFNMIFPDVKVVNINYRKSEDVKLFQGANFNFTKTWISKHYPTLLAGLKKIVGNYQNVGLITYKNLPNQNNFDEFLAKELDVKIFDHFGNVRGSNKFESVDCLLIVGRHCVNLESSAEFYNSLFGKYPDNSSSQCDIPVRKTNDKFSSIVNWQYKDPLLNEVVKFQNQSENVQAISRARIIYGSKKDVFIFSNESLGTRIEIDKFFRYEDFFEYDEALKGVSRSNVIISKSINAKIENTFQKRLELIKNHHSIKDSKNILIELGFSKNFAMNKKERKMFFEQAGYELINREWVKK